VKAVAVVLFLAGLLLAVRVMFFGVRRRVDEEHLAHRRWPLALAVLLVITGAMTYARGAGRGGVTAGWMAAVLLIGSAAAAGAWWLVQRSAAIPSTDPEDDPRYRFQGHIARVIESKGLVPEPGNDAGRISFRFDGTVYELDARWSPEARFSRDTSGGVGTEVVIERIEGDLAFVEPWAVVEERL